MLNNLAFLIGTDHRGTPLGVQAQIPSAAYNDTFNPDVKSLDDVVERLFAGHSKETVKHAKKAARQALLVRDLYGGFVRRGYSRDILSFLADEYGKTAQPAKRVAGDTYSDKHTLAYTTQFVEYSGSAARFDVIGIPVGAQAYTFPGLSAAESVEYRFTHEEVHRALHGPHDGVPELLAEAQVEHALGEYFSYKADNVENSGDRAKYQRMARVAQGRAKMYSKALRNELQRSGKRAAGHHAKKAQPAPAKKAA